MNTHPACVCACVFQNVLCVLLAIENCGGGGAGISAVNANVVWSWCVAVCWRLGGHWSLGWGVYVQGFLVVAGHAFLLHILAFGICVCVWCVRTPGMMCLDSVV